MNRRHFLSAVTAAVGAFALDPERALWVPGQRSHFDMGGPRLTTGQIRLIAPDGTLIGEWDHFSEVSEAVQRLRLYGPATLECSVRITPSEFGAFT